MGNTFASSKKEERVRNDIEKTASNYAKDIMKFVGTLDANDALKFNQILRDKIFPDHGVHHSIVDDSTKFPESKHTNSTQNHTIDFQKVDVASQTIFSWDTNLPIINTKDQQIYVINDEKTPGDNHKIQDTKTLLDAPIQTSVDNVKNDNKEFVQNVAPQHRENTDVKTNKKSLNILLLGQTGVGKSTWINAFANYLIYKTMDEAIDAKAPICVIPTKFKMIDNENQLQEIVFGKKDDNEIFSDGSQSSTQNAKKYFLEYEKYNIYLIDTPGIGDTRGLQQDEENMKRTLNMIETFEEIHAICFLFKANEGKLTPTFQYCIGELLKNLNKTAIKNACFMFTNARGTFYKTGDTLKPLKAYFNDLYEKDGLTVSINEENTFCLDNEAFRFICASFNGVQFSDEDRESFSKSWKYSCQEIKRFLKHISSIPFHNTTETVSLNEIRSCTLKLMGPLLESFNNLQSIDEKYQQEKAKLESIKNNIDKHPTHDNDEETIKKLKNKFKENKNEFDLILNAVAKFSIMLATNVISQKIDIFENRVEELIEIEKKMIQADPNYDDQKLNHLKKLHKLYQERCQIIIKEENSISIDQIPEIKEKLLTLPIWGAKICELFGIHSVDAN